MKYVQTPLWFGLLRNGYKFPNTITKEMISRESPLHNIMKELDDYDLKIDDIEYVYIVMRSTIHPIKDSFEIRCYSRIRQKHKGIETIKNVSIYDLSPEEIIDMIKTKIDAARK